MLRSKNVGKAVDQEDIDLGDLESNETVKAQPVRKNAPTQYICLISVVVFLLFVYHLYGTVPGTGVPESVPSRIEPTVAPPVIHPVPPAIGQPELPVIQPKPAGRAWPAAWLKKFTPEQLEASAQEADKWRIKSLAMMNHAFNEGYARAYGDDTVDPVTGQAGKNWGHGAYTLVDSLSTLHIMGFTTEFDKAAEWIDKNLNFEWDGLVSTFETIIRELGGLLSAYALSKNPIFKKKAILLGEKLLPAFQGLCPKPQINLGTGRAANTWFGDNVMVAEIGTFQLEFAYLSTLLEGEKKKLFMDKATAVFDYIIDNGGKDGLVPWGWYDGKHGKGFANTFVTMGAMADSYYEYLIKFYQMTGMTNTKWLDAWKASMKGMKERLVKRNEDYAVVVQELNRGHVKNQMDHLSCFIGGNLMYADMILKDEDRSGYWTLGMDITKGCVHMYDMTPTHLAPDSSDWTGQELRANNKHNDLRPETAESLFYAFYTTGDPKYRQQAGAILEAFEKHAYCEFGYCALEDVMSLKPVQRHDMESFFLAETMKYLYLTFLPIPSETIDLDNWVFNTEAHPLPVIGQQPG